MQQKADLTDPDTRVDVELLADAAEEPALAVQGMGQMSIKPWRNE